MRYKWFEKGAYINNKAKHFLKNEFDPLKIRKIAVIRHAAFGDQVITRPFLIEARRFFPNAKITLCAVSDYLYALPDDLVDQVHITYGKNQKNKINFLEKIRNLRELPEQDIIFDLASTNRSFWLSLLTSAKLKIGFPYKTLPFIVLYHAMIFRSDFVAEIDTQLHMLKLLGCNPTYPPNFGYPSNITSKNIKNPFILYFNGASQESKSYPIEKQIELIEKSINAYPNFKHIFLEGLNQREKANEAKTLKKYKNFSIQPSLELGQLTQLIAEATLVISTDTGIRNLAIATHTPTVGIFYSTVPFRYTPQYENHVIVMNADGSQPTPDQILSNINSIIKKP